ncbi:hypothetical protein [Dialister succinatiphilus]
MEKKIHDGALCLSAMGNGGFYSEGGNQKDSPEAVFLIYEISSFRL